MQLQLNPDRESVLVRYEVHGSELGDVTHLQDHAFDTDININLMCTPFLATYLHQYIYKAMRCWWLESGMLHCGAILF